MISYEFSTYSRFVFRHRFLRYNFIRAQHERTRTPDHEIRQDLSPTEFCRSRLHEWKSVKELSHFLRSQVVYANSSRTLFVLSKPPGLSVHGWKKSLVGRAPKLEYKTPSSEVVELLSVSRALTQLSDLLGLGKHKLEIIDALDFDYSGAVVLVSDALSAPVREEMNKFYNEFVLCQYEHEHYALYQSFLAIVYDPVDLKQRGLHRIAIKRIDYGKAVASHNANIPSNAKVSGRYTPNSKLENVPFTKQLSYMFDPNALSTRDVRFRRVFRPLYAHRVLSENEELGCALVELRTNSTRWQALPLYLQSLRARLLGDTIYASRLSRVLPNASESSSSRLGQATLLPLASANFDRVPLPAHIRRALVPRDFVSPQEQSRRVRSHSHSNSARSELQQQLYSTDVPVCAHRQWVYVPAASRLACRRREFTRVSVPLPAHFLYALDRLGLHVPSQAEADGALDWPLVGAQMDNLFKKRKAENKEDNQERSDQTTHPTE